MLVDIKIEGPRACGKSHLAKKVARFLEEELLATPPGKHHVTIRSTNAPKPKGVDTRPLDVWELEYSFDA